VALGDVAVDIGAGRPGVLGEVPGNVRAMSTTPALGVVPRELAKRRGEGSGRGGHIAYDALWYAAPVPSYEEQEISDDFEDHQAGSGRPIVTPREAHEVWDNGFLPRRNSRGSPDTRLLIGRTDGGRRVTLVSRHLGDGAWLTYTAWDTKEADLA
jgi:hypothetical protein